MLSSELVELIVVIQAQKCESNRIELKSAQQGCPKIYDTLSSFSNQSGGGIMIFGINEKNYSVCGVYDAADLQKKISEQCLEMEPVVRAVCAVAEMEGRIVVSAEIPELDVAQRPCFYKGSGRMKGSWIRVGDADRHMTEYEIYSFEAYRNKTQDELRNTERALPEDIDTVALQEYLLVLEREKPKLAALPQEKLLRLQGFMENRKPTLAGLMLFADYPQAYFPRLCITAVVIPGFEIGDTSSRGERFIDNISIDGTIPQMLKQALQFIRRNIAVRTLIDSDSGERNDKTEYPMTAVREIILNALVHRDYSMHTETSPITIALYRDRMVVENPGGLYGRLTLDTLGTVSADTRNPFIANAMELMDETENRFSGIPTIRKEMQRYQLPAPQFENERGVFRVTLYNENSAVSAFSTGTLQTDILAFCEIPRTRGELSERFPNITLMYLMTKYINPMVEQGLLKLSMPDKPKSKFQKFQTKL